jgi:hypothetical protein
MKTYIYMSSTKNTEQQPSIVIKEVSSHLEDQSLELQISRKLVRLYMNKLPFSHLAKDFMI